MNIPFHKPIFPSDLNQLLGDSTTSGWVTTGPKVKEFENLLSRYLNAEFVIAVNSGTAALHLALAAWGLKPEDQFIAPTYTFVASVEVGEYLGAHPVLVDSNPNTFNFDLNHVLKVLESDIKKSIKAIIPVHFGGSPVGMRQVYELAKAYNLFVLEDAAHALETVSNNGKVGDTDHAAAFSFYANKNITTGGEGGALATNDEKLADKVRVLSLHGMNKDGWKRFETGGKWAYDVSELGYKYNMTDISASFGIEQLTHLSEWHRMREKISKRYTEGLGCIEGIICPQQLSGVTHAWHLYVVRSVPELWKITRNEIIQKINEVGIGTSVHYIPVHMHSYYQKKYGYSPDDFPIAKQLSSTVISLPIYPDLTDLQLDYVIDSINNIWLKYRI